MGLLAVRPAWSSALGITRASRISTRGSAAERKPQMMLVGDGLVFVLERLDPAMHLYATTYAGAPT